MTISILDAMGEEALFAPFFCGTSWLPWMVFLAALFALPMDAAALKLYRMHTGHVDAPATLFKEACLIIGRRGGKSRILALVAVYLGCFMNYAEYLAPGEVATIAVIASDRRQARAIFRFVTGLLKHVPMLSELIESETAESIILTGGVVIEIHTASFRVTRGYSLAAALCDEIAFWRLDDSSANLADEILSALRPGLANLPGSMLLMASSPYSKRGPLYSAYKRH